MPQKPITVNPFLPILPADKCFSFEGGKTSEYTFHEASPVRLNVYFTPLKESQQYERAYGGVLTWLIILQAKNTITNDDTSTNVKWQHFTQMNETAKRNIAVHDFANRLNILMSDPLTKKTLKDKLAGNLARFNHAYNTHFDSISSALLHVEEQRTSQPKIHHSGTISSSEVSHTPTFQEDLRLLLDGCMDVLQMIAQNASHELVEHVSLTPVTEANHDVLFTEALMAKQQNAQACDAPHHARIKRKTS
jgi:hypothetical protein